MKKNYPLNSEIYGVIGKTKWQKRLGVIAAFMFVILCTYLVVSVYAFEGETNRLEDRREYINQLTAAQPIPVVLAAETEVTGPLIPENTHTMKITAFSSHECGTPWCQRHAEEPRGQRVALNAKYGTQWSAVYIPAYDKTYQIPKDCGVNANLSCTTDHKTDLDIWFGSEYDQALDFGTKDLLVTLIP